MAKSENRTQVFDASSLGEESLDEIRPEEHLPTGRWVLDYVKGKVRTWNNDRGPGTAVDMEFMPVEYVPAPGEEEVEIDLDVMPRLVTHTQFVKNVSDKRELSAVFSLLGVARGGGSKVNEDLEAAKGGRLSAFVKPNGTFNNRLQHRFSHFRSVEQSA